MTDPRDAVVAAAREALAMDNYCTVAESGDRAGPMNYLRDALAALDAAPLPRWRHVRRGTEYTEIGHAELQLSTYDPMDGVEVTIYRGDDGRTWVRMTDEFEDGRFERIEP